MGKVIFKRNTLLYTDIFMLLLIIGVALFVRLHHISQYYFSFDDLWHIGLADHATLAEVVSSNWANEIHPPLLPIILHYILKITRDPLCLRMISLVPSVLLIPLSFALGYRFMGRGAAYLMAYMAAFCAGPLLLSIVIRPYALQLLLFTFGLGCILSYFRHPRTVYLYSYGVAIAAALLLQYSSVIFTAAAGIIVWVEMNDKKQPSSHIRLWVGIHIALAAILASAYGMAAMHSPYADPAPVKEFLQIAYNQGYDLSIENLVAKLCLIIMYFSWQELMPVCFIVILVAILITPLLQKHSIFFLMLVTALLISIVMAWLRLYPLLPGRWSAYLFPLVMLICAHIFQLCCNRLVKLPPYVAFIPCVLLLGLGLQTPLFPSVLPDMPNEWETVVYKKDYDSLTQHIIAHSKPGDIIIAEKRMAWYFLYDKENTMNYQQVAPDIYRVYYKDIPVYFFDIPGFLDDGWDDSYNQSLVALLKGLQRYVSDKPVTNAWFICVSYYSTVTYPLIPRATNAKNLYEGEIGNLIYFMASHADNALLYGPPSRGAVYSISWPLLSAYLAQNLPGGEIGYSSSLSFCSSSLYLSSTLAKRKVRAKA